MKNFLYTHEVKCQGVPSFSKLVAVIANTHEETPDAVQYLHARVNGVEEGLAAVNRRVDDHEERLSTLEAEFAATAKKQFEVARDHFKKGTSMRIAFQDLHSKVFALLDGIRNSRAGVFSTTISNQAQKGLLATSALGTTASIVTSTLDGGTAAGIIQFCIQSLILYRAKKHTHNRAEGVANATFETESEPNIIATSVVLEIMEKARDVYGDNISEQYSKQLVNALFDAIKAQVDVIYKDKKQFANVDELVSFLSSQAFAKIEAAKAQAATTVDVQPSNDVRLDTTRKSHSGTSNGSRSTPVKSASSGSQHSTTSSGKGSPKPAFAAAHEYQRAATVDVESSNVVRLDTTRKYHSGSSNNSHSTPVKSASSSSQHSTPSSGKGSPKPAFAPAQELHQRAAQKQAALVVAVERQERYEQKPARRLFLGCIPI